MPCAAITPPKTATTRCWPSTTNSSSTARRRGVGKRPAVRRRAGRRSASAGERWRPDRERGLPALCVVRDPAAGENWQLAPSVIAQHSEDRYRDGDRYDWATFNLRVSQGSPLTSPCCMRPRGSIWISIRTGAAIAIMTTFISIRRCAVISTS